MNSVEGLGQWLNNCLDEDERLVRSVTTPGAWRVGRSHGGATVEGEGWSVGSVDDLDAAHIAAWSPARVLREIDAKRRIIAEVVPEIDGMEDRIDGEWGVGATDPAERESAVLLRLLALPYADRPGYRPEWAPPSPR